MTAPDDPRLAIPGPPGGERYLCPLRRAGGPCPWYLDVPAPDIEPLERVGDDYVLTVAAVPMAAIEERILEHLRADHDRREVWERLLAYLTPDAPTA